MKFKKLILSITLLASFAGVCAMENTENNPQENVQNNQPAPQISININTPGGTTFVYSDGLTLIKALFIANANPNHELSQNLNTAIQNTFQNLNIPQGDINQANQTLTNLTSSNLMYEIATTNNNQVALAASINNQDNAALGLMIIGHENDIVQACNAIIENIDELQNPLNINFETPNNQNNNQE